MANKVTYILELRDHYSRVAEKVKAANERIKRSYDKVNVVIKKSTRLMREQFRALRANGAAMRTAGGEMTMGFTAGLGLIAGAALKTTAAFEQMEVAINTLSGGAKKGGALMKELKTFAATTPFEMTELMKSSQLLLGAQFAPEEVVGQLSMLGDVAAGTGARIDELVYTMTEIKQIGKASSIELKELTRRGFNVKKALQAMAAENGVILTMEQISEAASNGAITFDVVQAALKHVTGEGGLFNKMMILQSKTLKGVWSNAIDSMTFALDKMGKTLVKSTNLKKVIAQAADAVTKFAEKFEKFAEKHPDITLFIIGFLTLLAVMGPILILLGAMASGVGVLASAFAGLATVAGLVSAPVLAIGLAIAGVVAGIKYVYDNWDRIKGSLGIALTTEGGAAGTGGRSGRLRTSAPSESLAAGTAGKDVIELNIKAPEGTVEKVKQVGRRRGGRNLKVGVNNLASAI